MTFKQRIESSKKMVVLCGAGISTASGVPDFKTMYNQNKKLRKALEVKTFKKHTEVLTQFLMNIVEGVPNEAHYFLQRLNKLGRLIRCYTMNIDGLEARVLPSYVLRHIHGRVDDVARCGSKRVAAKHLIKMAKNYEISKYNEENNCYIRPGFVMYGEKIRDIEDIDIDLRNADTILCMGTRLSVNPIASIIKSYSHKVICMNNEPVGEYYTVVGDCNKICRILLR